MGKFKLYNVDLKNLSPGVHEFEYLLENKFFVDIDGTEVQKGKVKVHLTVKRSSMMFEMNFQIEGVVVVHAIDAWTIWKFLLIPTIVWW